MIQTLLFPRLEDALSWVRQADPTQDWWFICGDCALPTTADWYRRLEDATAHHPEAVFGVTYNAMGDAEAPPQFVMPPPSHPNCYDEARQYGEAKSKSRLITPAFTLHGNLLARAMDWKRIAATNTDLGPFMPQPTWFQEALRRLDIPLLIIEGVYFHRWKEDLLC